MGRPATPNNPPHRHAARTRTHVLRALERRHDITGGDRILTAERDGGQAKPSHVENLEVYAADTVNRPSPRRSLFPIS